MKRFSQGFILPTVLIISTLVTGFVALILRIAPEDMESLTLGLLRLDARIASRGALHFAIRNLNEQSSAYLDKNQDAYWPVTHYIDFESPTIWNKAYKVPWDRGYIEFIIIRMCEKYCHELVVKDMVGMYGYSSEVLYSVPIMVLVRVIYPTLTIPAVFHFVHFDFINYA